MTLEQAARLYKIVNAAPSVPPSTEFTLRAEHHPYSTAQEILNGDDTALDVDISKAVAAKFTGAA
jgi:hypothetical protein